ncbi:MAG: ferredoxin family protein [Actinomycetota bacterium]|nr:ferredoxin family protein [Actinomycetota bacterium]
MRSDALFIALDVDDDVAGDRELAAKLTEVCPVDIFGQDDDGALRLVEDNLDECVLCELCLEVAPAGTVTVHKLYEDGATLSRG